MQTKLESDYLLKIDASFLSREGYFRQSKSGILTWTQMNTGDKNRVSIYFDETENTLRISYTVTDYDGEKNDINYKVKVVTTKCNYGGERFWFICPLQKKGIPCGRRIRVLYQGQDYFGCRHCYDLTYKSRNQTKTYREYPYSTMDAYFKIEDIEKDMKIRFYNGKPTRKQKQIDKLYRRIR